MKKTVDLIKKNNETYANLCTANGLLAKMIRTQVENIYGFNFYFGKDVDEKTLQNMNGTYWTRVLLTSEQEAQVAKEAEIITIR